MAKKRDRKRGANSGKDEAAAAARGLRRRLRRLEKMLAVAAAKERRRVRKLEKAHVRRQRIEAEIETARLAASLGHLNDASIYIDDSSGLPALAMRARARRHIEEGAATFVEQPFSLPGGLPTRNAIRIEGGSGWDRLYTTPGKEGDIWLTALNGLYHSTDTGKTFTRMEGVTELRGFGFGKAAPGSSDPALYLVGVANGQRGILRSDDWARTWTRVNDDQHQFGLIGQITGDPKLYGRVYVGTFGRGILYGDPVRKQR